MDAQGAKRDRVMRGPLLRAQAGDLALLASESSLPTDLVVAAHEARLAAIAADPRLNTITETEAIVAAVLDQQAKDALSVAAVTTDVRRAAVKQLLADLNFPTPKNPAVQLAFARLGSRLVQYVADQKKAGEDLTLPDVTP